MGISIRIIRAGPLVSVQDEGRFGHLAHGVSASGPMDRAAFRRAGAMLGNAGSAGLEITSAGIAFEVTGGELRAAFAGADFKLTIDGAPRDWDAVHTLGERGRSAAALWRIEASPGRSGNFGYIRFAAEIELSPVLGSRSTNTTIGLGGYQGRALKSGDILNLSQETSPVKAAPAVSHESGPIRFIWGIHAEHFSPEIRASFTTSEFEVSTRMDRMGIRLSDPAGVFSEARILSLVSDAVVPGDIQILGDGTPIVLMRDHQPTGGYPRIGTVISADLDRFAQLRPKSRFQFQPVTVEHAQSLMKKA